MKQLPEWVTETPRLSLTGYFLTVLDGGETIQDVELTLQEYEALKKQLAISRGLIEAEETK